MHPIQGQAPQEHPRRRPLGPQGVESRPAANAISRFLGCPSRLRLPFDLPRERELTGLPGLDGYEVARRLRREPELAGTLLVALTGYGQDSDRQKALQAGFDDHLVKPVDFQKLEKLLRRAAARSKGHA